MNQVLVLVLSPICFREFEQEAAPLWASVSPSETGKAWPDALCGPALRT